MAKRATSAKAATAKPPKAPTTLPKQFEAALAESTVEELRAYLRDLAARQRPIRADFLLYRSASAGAADRASYVEAIRMALKQPPKTKARSYYYDAPNAAEKRVLRFQEIAGTLLRTGQQYVTDRADLPAARAIGLAVLEAELTELDPKALSNSNSTFRSDALQLLRDLWAALPTSEARELLFDELLALPTSFGPPGSMAHRAILELLVTLHPGQPDRLRAILVVADALLARLPARTDSLLTQTNFFSEAAMAQLAAETQIELLVKLKISLLEELQEPEAIITTLKAHAWRPHLRSQGASMLLRLNRPAEARDLLQEGLATLPAQAHNWRSQWQNLLLKAEGQLGNAGQVRPQAQKMLQDSGYRNIDAYIALRDSYPPAEWPAVRQELLDQVSARLLPGWPKDQHAHQLALTELPWSSADQNPERIMVLLETLRSLYYLIEYTDMLWPTHAERVTQLGEALLPDYFAANNGRLELHQAAGLMKRLSRRPDARPRLQALANDLRRRFPRRTVLAEILAVNGF